MLTIELHSIFMYSFFQLLPEVRIFAELIRQMRRLVGGEDVLSETSAVFYLVKFLNRCAQERCSQDFIGGGGGAQWTESVKIVQAFNNVCSL